MKQTFDPCSGNRSGASGSSAAAGVINTGRGSMSRSTASAASMASTFDSATTAAQMSPTNLHPIGAEHRAIQRRRHHREHLHRRQPEIVPAWKTARTPGIASASDTSTPSSTPWATIERTNATCSIPGSTRSSRYLPAPVSSVGSSRRSTAFPRIEPDDVMFPPSCVPVATRTPLPTIRALSSDRPADFLYHRRSYISVRRTSAPCHRPSGLITSDVKGGRMACVPNGWSRIDLRPVPTSTRVMSSIGCHHGVGAVERCRRARHRPRVTQPLQQGLRSVVLAPARRRAGADVAGYRTSPSGPDPAAASVRSWQRLDTPLTDASKSNGTWQEGRFFLCVAVPTGTEAAVYLPSGERLIAAPGTHTWTCRQAT